MADEVHEVRRILAVMDGEGRLEADRAGELAQQPRADAVEGARPGEGGERRAGLGAHGMADDPLDPPRHLARRPAREGHQQDARRIGAVDDEMGDPVGKRVGLARPRPGDDEERPGRPRGGASPPSPNAMLDGAALVGIELVEIGGGGHGESICPLVTGSKYDSCFVRKLLMRIYPLGVCRILRYE